VLQNEMMPNGMRCRGVFFAVIAGFRLTSCV